MPTDVGHTTEFGSNPTYSSGSSIGGEESAASVGLEQAKRVTHAATDKVMNQADQKISTLTDRLSSLASRLDDSAGDGSSFESEIIHRAASWIRQGSESLQGKSTSDLMDAARQQLRDRPGLVTAGLVAIGFVGGRLLRS